MKIGIFNAVAYQVYFLKGLSLSTLNPTQSQNGRRNHLECLSDLKVGRLQDKSISEGLVWRVHDPFYLVSK